VREAALYPWCSAGWFQRRATTSFYKQIMQMKIDRVHVEDEFEVDLRDV
jgi:putative transposase